MQLLKTQSLLFCALRVSLSDPRSPTLTHPDNPMHDRNSSSSSLNAVAHPLSQSTAIPHSAGRPIQTMSAPRHRALNMSDPRLTPPSKCCCLVSFATSV